ncbi:MAG TPA: Fe-S cluster assembly protein HesB, partial [Thermoproteota archaeon]|nr:Fe-S cluster assembly protein HesB [Thermoproteota archaeon]
MAADDRVQRTIQELGRNLLDFSSESFDDRAVKKLIRTVKAARRIFVYGAGRSGMIGRCFV